MQLYTHEEMVESLAIWGIEREDYRGLRSALFGISPKLSNRQYWHEIPVAYASVMRRFDEGTLRLDDRGSVYAVWLKSKRRGVVVAGEVSWDDPYESSNSQKRKGVD